MRFLADESCDGRVIERLREEGHDVLSIAESQWGSRDEQIVRIANDQVRVLITEDKDFGQMFFASGEPTPGVILLRVPAPARQWLISNIASIVAQSGSGIAVTS